MKPDLLRLLAIPLVMGAVACSQYTSAQKSATFRGCLQGDTTRGFSLLAPTGDGSGADTQGQTMTYKVVASAGEINLSDSVNKVVEIDGTLSTAEADRGKIPSPVADSIRSPGGAGGSGTMGEDTSFDYAHGTLTARAVRQLEPTCAVRFAPDADK